jgi:hypothetical protein
MDIKEIENELNALILKACESGGFVWIVDKKQNDYAVRLKAPIRLSALILEEKEQP